MSTTAPVRTALRRRPWLVPSLAAAVDAVAFLVLAPPVNDLYAARAHEAAAADGVGWTYWFAWFGGGAAPGGYSLLAPWLAVAIGSVALGALATLAITPLTWWALRAAPHPLAATWVATASAAASLWSGRVPFAAGVALAIGALGLLTRRPVLAALLAVLSTALSPLCGAFLGLGLAALFLTVPALRRQCLVAGGALAAVLGALYVGFGSPGPQPFAFTLALSAMMSAAAVLLTRPPPALATAVAITVVLCPLFVAVPNGVGSNLARLPFYVLPVLGVAYARPLAVRTLRSVPALTLISVLPASYFAGRQLVTDLVSATQPIASASYYSGLQDELQRLAPKSCRVEVIDGVSHAAAFLLAGDVMLARGWETQADHAYNRTVLSADLDAAGLRGWLDDNAVCLVAVPSDPSVKGPEIDLLRARLPPAYLSAVWHEERWTLLRVRDPVPLVGRPASVARYTQAALTVDVPCTCTVPVRIRWSRYLTAGDATVRADSVGWTTLAAPHPGRYELTGALLHGLLS